VFDIIQFLLVTFYDSCAIKYRNPLIKLACDNNHKIMIVISWNILSHRIGNKYWQNSWRGCLFLKVNVKQSYNTFGTTHLVTWSHFPADSNPQWHPCANLCKFHIFTHQRHQACMALLHFLFVLKPKKLLKEYTLNQAVILNINWKW